MRTGKSRIAVRPTIRGVSLLVVALLADAVVTGVNGLVYLLAAPVLSGWLGLSPAALYGVGAFLVVYACIVVLIARLRPAPGPKAWFPVLMNILWCAGSVLVAAAGASSLTGWGRAWVLFQAIVVLAFAVAQFVGIRLSGRPRP